MSRQHVFRQLGLAALFLVLGLGASGCASQPPSNAHADGSIITARTSPPTISTASGAANPRRLLIPVIGVNAPVENVGITPLGDLDTPSRSPWVDTGWYASGPRPGETGSAVIDGHLNRPGNLPAVFWLLYKLHKGDGVDILDSNGRKLHFQVIDVEYYEPQNAPIQQIFGNASGKYLNLITCAGDWIPSQHQTTLRLVVYTRLISP